MRHSSTVFALSLLALGAAQAASLSSNFDTPISIGASDTRVIGDASTWYAAGNGATGAQVRSGVGLNGSAALVIGNNGSGNDGVIHGVQSGRLSAAAGEASVAPNDLFESSFWFRTASSSAVAGLAFKTEVWGSDRDSWLGFFSGSNGGLEVEAYGVGPADANGPASDVSQFLGSELAWGSWYQVKTTVQFRTGANNDTVTHEIFDSLSNLIGTLQVPTWEQGQRTSDPSWGTPWNGGQLVAVDAIGFQTRASITGAAGEIFIDDVSWSSRLSDDAQAVPEPAALALAGLALLGAGLSTRRRRG